MARTFLSFATSNLKISSAGYEHSRCGAPPTVLAAALFVPIVLLLDGPALAVQAGLGLTTALFLILVVRVSRTPISQILIAILIATIGEVILSMLWGLYDYRHTATIPLYVPFGHGVFYALAAMCVPMLQRFERRVVRSTLVIGSLIAVVSYFLFNDQWGLLWWIAAAALIARSRNALLLSVCFVFTMALEWLGTGLGNWQWASVVPGLGLHSANPPSGVGILYVILDALTLWVWGLRSRSPVPLTRHADRGAIPGVVADATTPG